MKPKVGGSLYFFLVKKSELSFLVLLLLLFAPPLPPPPSFPQIYIYIYGKVGGEVEKKKNKSPLRFIKKKEKRHFVRGEIKIKKRRGKLTLPPLAQISTFFYI